MERAIWERGHGCTPIEKALLLARAARPGASDDELAGLTVVERDLLLVGLRERVLGPRLDAVATCPACGQALEFALDLTEVGARIAAPAGGHEAAVDAFTFRLRPPSIGELAECVEVSDSEAARLKLAACCVVEAREDGAPVGIDAIPATVVARLADRLDELDDPSDVEVALSCPACSHAWEAPFDIASCFYAELASAARRLLEDVHVLASAYGWSERDILAMSPARREFYLERSR